MKLRTVLLWLSVLALTALPALAQQDLYDNGPTNGTTTAFTIDLGLVVSDQFTVNNSVRVEGLNFAAWLFPGDVLQSAEVSITSSEFGGTTYFDQVVSFTQTNCALNQLGYNVCNETASFSPVNLNAGSYWLDLQNAVTNTGDPAYWDVNNGPSAASEASIGTIPSESFTILGEGGTTATTSTTPEPGTVILLGSGAMAVFGVVRRKFAR